MNTHQRRSEQDWQHIMDDFAQSNLSQSDYCHQHALAPSTFSKWRKQLGLTRLSSLNKCPQSSDDVIHFQPLPSTTKIPDSPGSSTHIQLSLPGDITLTITTECPS
ncbi:MAG: IS66 family insertion sequence element accessory protein TnpA [bacterium]